MENDDDEFGGFEAAEPVDQSEAHSGVQAGPSPWAFFPGAGGQNQPDLIQPPGAAAGAEMTRPRVQDPLEPRFGSAAAARHADDALLDDLRLEDEPQASGVTWQGSGSRSLSEQVLEPHFGSRKSDQPVPDGVLDLDLTNRQSKVSHDRPPDDLDLELEPDIAAAAAVIREQFDAAGEAQVQWPNAAAERSGQEGGQEEEAEHAAVDEERSELQEQLLASRQEKTRLQQEVEELVRNTERLEQEVGRLRNALTEQQEKYSALQEQHSRDLDEMRQAGHQALAIIVDEYKELCKTAVLEQKQACQTQVMAVIEEERDKYTQLLSQQAEDMEAKLESERSSLHDYVKQVLAEQVEQTQKEIQSRVDEGKAELENHVKQSLQKEREESEELIKTTVMEEAEKLKETFEEERSRLASLYEEEREKLKCDIAEAISAESGRCQECMKEAIKLERERGEKLSGDVLSQAEQHVKSYLDDHKQRDAAVRKKSLATIELFLSSAQKQLQVLLSTEPTNTDNNTDAGSSHRQSETEES